MAQWSLTSLQLKLNKIGARVVRHPRAITFQLAEVVVTGPMVRAILAAIRRLQAETPYGDRELRRVEPNLPNKTAERTKHRSNKQLLKQLQGTVCTVPAVYVSKTASRDGKILPKRQMQANLQPSVKPADKPLSPTGLRPYSHQMERKVLTKLLNHLRGKLQSAEDRLIEDHFYEKIYHEIENNDLHPAAKARAIADVGENYESIKKAYVKHRLRMLQDNFKINESLAPTASKVEIQSQKIGPNNSRANIQNPTEAFHQIQLQDFIRRMEKVDDKTIAGMLIETVALFDEPDLRTQNLSDLLLEYSPSKERDFVQLIKTLNQKIINFQLDGQMMLAPPLIILMHTARGIIYDNATQDAMRMWSVLIDRGRPNVSMQTVTPMGEVTEEIVAQAKSFVPAALYERHRMLTIGKDFDAIEIREEPPSEDRAESKTVEKITDMILETLQLQLELSGNDAQRMPDDFVVGYIAGYCDAFLQKTGISNNSAEGLGVLTVTFQSLYGLDVGGQRLRDFFRMQNSMSQHMEAGLTRGGQDVFEWLSSFNSIEPPKGPMGLFQYLRENQF